MDKQRQTWHFGPVYAADLPIETAGHSDPIAPYTEQYARFVERYNHAPNAFLIASDRQAELLTYAREHSQLLGWLAAGRLPEVGRVITSIMGCQILSSPDLPAGTIRAVLLGDE